MDAARVATVLDHFEQARCPQARVLLKRESDEVSVRLDLGESGDSAAAHETIGRNGTVDDVGVKRQLGDDGSDLPVLGEEQAPDLGFLLCVNHGTARRRRAERPLVGSLADVTVRT